MRQGTDIMSTGLEPTILSSAASGISRFIDAQGGNSEKILNSISIPSALIGAYGHKLELAAFCRMFNVSSNHTGLDNFGLNFGENFDPRDMGALGYAAISSLTLGDALSNIGSLLRYHQGASQQQLKILPGGIARFEYQILKSDIVDRRQDAEFSLVTFANIIRECCGRKWVPHEVHFEHPIPADIRDHRRIFDAPIYFSQSTNALVFDSRILDKQMPSRDLRLLSIMRDILTHSGSSDERIEFYDLVKSEIRKEISSGNPSIESVSKKLGVSPFFLKKEIGSRGSSYKKAVDEVRRDLAMHYLKDSTLNLSNLSNALGYSEVSAFSRAFRRWTGESASTYRLANLRNGTLCDE